MNELALFSGAGGGILGSVLLGHRIVCAVEIDPYCREILLRRQEEKILPPFPIWDDVRTFDGRPWRGVVDIVSAGFPCQPFSVAGRRKGEDDERNMWPETIRIIREVGPAFAFLENVPGLVRTDYFGQILGDLAEAGFDAEWTTVSAAEVGAPHIRERLWILAYASEPRCSSGQGEQGQREAAFSGEPERQGCKVAYANGRGREVERLQEHVGLEGASGREPDGRRAGRRRDGTYVADADQERLQDVQGCEADAELHWNGASRRAGWWDAEPDVGRVAHGVAARVDRLRALGNGQVPRVVVEAWNRLNAQRKEV